MSAGARAAARVAAEALRLSGVLDGGDAAVEAAIAQVEGVLDDGLVDLARREAALTWLALAAPGLRPADRARYGDRLAAVRAALQTIAETDESRVLEAVTRQRRAFAAPKRRGRR